MPVTKKEVEYIAKLAHLEFTDEEKEKLTHQMNEILDHVGKLNELNIIIDSEKNSFTIKAASAEVGEHVNNIPAKVTGEELKMTFNHRYIFECLANISSSKILLRFVGEGKPLLLTGADDVSFQYLVMPMNTL